MTEHINHERIHIRQQLETLIVGFYLIYFLEFIFYRFNHTRYNAYKMISFEREAYQYENDIDYLKKRKCYAWLRNHSK